MSNLKILSNHNGYEGYVLPENYETQGKGWVNAKDPKELAKIGTLIKKNGESHTIVEVKKFYHSPTELAIRRIFATILCICTLGTAAFIKGVRNFFNNANIVYLAAETDSVNPLMKIDAEGLFPKAKDHDLKLNKRAARKAEAAANPYEKPEEPFKKMQVEKLVKMSKEDALKASERAARKAEAQAEAQAKAEAKAKAEAEAQKNARNIEEQNFSDPSDNMQVKELVSDLNDQETNVLPIAPKILYAENGNAQVGHSILHLSKGDPQVNQEAEENNRNVQEQNFSDPFNNENAELKQKKEEEIIPSLDDGVDDLDFSGNPPMVNTPAMDIAAELQLLNDLLNQQKAREKAEQEAREKAEQEARDAQEALRLQNQPDPEYVKLMGEFIEQQRLRDLENRKKAQKEANNNPSTDLDKQAPIFLQDANLKIEPVD